MNKKIYLNVFFAFFTFSHCHGMHTSAVNNAPLLNLFSHGLQNFTKNYSVVTLFTFISISTTLFYFLFYHVSEQPSQATQSPQITTDEGKYFWIKSKGGELLQLTLKNAISYEILKTYIDLYKKKNSKETPLVIGNAEKLSILKTWKFFINFFVAERQQWAVNLHEHLAGDVNTKPAIFLLDLYKDPNLYFLFNTVMDNISMDFGEAKNNSAKKKCTRDGKFYYWKNIINDKTTTFYDASDNAIKSFDSVDFILERKNNFVIYLQLIDQSKNNNKAHLYLYDLNTQQTTQLSITCFNVDSSFAISPNGKYVVIIPLKRKFGLMEIFDISNRLDIQRRKLVNFKASCCAFSPDSTKFLCGRYEDGELIQFDIVDIDNIIKTTLISNIWCINIIFNEDSKHLCIVKGAQRHRDKILLININYPQIKIELPEYYHNNGKYTPPRIFINKTDLIKWEDYNYQKKVASLKVFTKYGECIYSRDDNDAFNNRPELNWKRCVKQIQSYLTILKQDITTSQLLLLKNIYAQPIKPLTVINFENDHPMKSTYDSFNDRQKKCLKEQFFITGTPPV